MVEVLADAAASTSVDRGGGHRRGGADLGVAGDGGPGRPCASTVSVVRYDNRTRAALTVVTLQAPAGSPRGAHRRLGCGQVDRPRRAAGLRRAQRRHHALRRAAPAGGARAAWRAHFSWLPQRPHLFNATLGENLRLGAPDASDEELLQVLDAVGLADLLADLPAGL